MRKRYSKMLKISAAVLAFQLTVSTAHLAAFNAARINPAGERAVFFNELQRTASDPNAQMDVARAAQNHSGLFTAFLDDLVATTALIEKQKFLEPSTDPVNDLIERWSNLETSHDQNVMFHPVLESLLKEFSKSLEDNTPPESRNPFDQLSAFFETVSARELSGIERLFQIEWPSLRSRSLQISETKTVRTRAGIENVSVTGRSVLETINGELKFFELIQNDQLNDIAGVPNQISILHRTLDEMIQDESDPKAIALVRHFVDLIDQSIDQSYESGQFDDFTYRYFQDPSLQAKVLAVPSHPLLKPPYRPDTFKVLDYYQ